MAQDPDEPELLKWTQQADNYLKNQDLYYYLPDNPAVTAECTAKTIINARDLGRDRSGPLGTARDRSGIDRYSAVSPMHSCACSFGVPGCSSIRSRGYRLTRRRRVSGSQQLDA